MSVRNAKRFQLAGWVMFILSAVLFIWTTALAGDRIGLAASLMFLAACFVFLVPLVISSDEEVAK